MTARNITISRAALAVLAALSMAWPACGFAQISPEASGTAATAPARTADPSLFNDLGGLPVITQVVNDFVAIMLQDERIRHTFAGTNLQRLDKTLIEQFCQISGGGCTYTGDPMKEVHQGLKLTNAHFNALVEDLQLAMDKHGIASHTQNRLLALLAPMQRDTVTR